MRPHDGLRARIRRDTRELGLSLLHVEYRARQRLLQTRERAHTRTDHDIANGLGLPVPRTTGKIVFIIVTECCLSRLCYLYSWWSERTKEGVTAAPSPACSL